MRTLILVIILSGCFLACSRNSTVSERMDEPRTSTGQPDSATVVEKPRIDTTIMRRFPLLPNSEEAIVTFQLAGPDWTQPVQWRIVVSSDSLVLYEKAGTSESFDEVFNDPNLMPQCTDPVSCKQEWFLTEWTNPVYEAYEADDHVHRQVPESLKALGYGDEEIDQLTQHFLTYYEGKEIPSVQFMFDPISDTSWPLAYHPSIHHLVVIFMP